MWHAIAALGQHTRLDDVGRVMRSPLLDCTHGKTWHEITALGQHTRSNDVGRGMTLPPLYSTHGRNDVGHGMPSSPLGSTHNRTTSGVACHHIPWTTNTVERCRAWHAITALGQHTQADDVGHGMLSLLLDSTQGRMTSGVACHRRPWTAHTVG